MAIKRRIAPDEQPMREPRPMLQRYYDLFPPTCEAKGCTDDAERGEMFCARHALVDAF